MLLQIEGVLDKETVAGFRKELAAAPWSDGKVTAGYQSALAKNNLQLPEDSDAAQKLGAKIIAALGKNLLFQSAALPDEIFPPLFNLYREGHGFDIHVDNAYRPRAQGRGRMRTDLSATLFLAEPDSYEGGELVVEDTYGEHDIKLPAGDMILYPATSLHRVTPIRSGERLAAFFWIRSLVPEDSRRAILFDMDMSIQSLRREVADDHAALITLTGCYHNLLRLWGGR